MKYESPTKCKCKTTWSGSLPFLPNRLPLEYFQLKELHDKQILFALPSSDFLAKKIKRTQLQNNKCRRARYILCLRTKHAVHEFLKSENLEAIVVFSLTKILSFLSFSPVPQKDKICWTNISDRWRVKKAMKQKSAGNGWVRNGENFQNSYW